MPRISVDGSIGAGKTTVLRALGDAFPEVPVFAEPLDEWGTHLDDFYADPATHSLEFSLRVLLSFQPPFSKTTCIVERSPVSCRHVFTQMLYNEGKLSLEAWELFKGYYDVLGWDPDVILFIDTPADMCFDRISSRGRACEADIDIPHLRRLEFAYQTVLKYGNPAVKVIRLDGTLEPAQLAAAAVTAVKNLKL